MVEEVSSMVGPMTKVKLTRKQKEQLVDKLRAHANIAHAAAAWGFDASGFWMEKAADIIEDYETTEDDDNEDTSL